jgi:Tfp pilus assembly protein PilF
LICTKITFVAKEFPLRIMNHKNSLRITKSAILFSRVMPSTLLIGMVLHFHSLFFDLRGQGTADQAQYCFRVRVIVAEKTSELAIKVKLARNDGTIIGERELGYEGTAIFDQLVPGQYMVTIERENQTTIARPLEIKALSVKTLAWEIRITGNSTKVRESTKESFQKNSNTGEELSSSVPKKALKAFQQASEESARGNYRKAIEDLQKAVKEAPNFLEAYNNLGAQYQRLKEWNQAIEAYKRAIEIKGDSPLPYLNLGNIYLERGELDSAVKAFQSVLELEDGNLRAHLALGKIYLEKRDYGRAEVHLEAATRLNPLQNRQAFLALIQIEVMLQRYDRAKYFLNSFQMYFPSDPEIEKLKQTIEKEGPR